MSRLEVKNLTVRRGTKNVIEDLSFTLETGRVTAFLGPNGAGKSSLVLALAGALASQSGEISLDGQSLFGASPELIRRAGVAAVPEGHRLLAGMSVEDNLAAAGFHLSKKQLGAAVAEVYEIFPELAGRRDQRAGSMSGGQQQMVALGQAVVSRPRFILADEMSLGLAPLIVTRLMRVVERLAASGVGILLIEQFTGVALGLADEAFVLSRGRFSYGGSPRKLLAQPELLHTAYLGETAAVA